MSERYFQHTYANGLTLLAEQMPGMKSAAMTFLLPAGVATDPEGAVGVSTVLSDLVLRGAGNRGSKELTDHLDFLGLQRSSTVGVFHTRLGAAAVGRKLLEALPAYADIVMRPQLPEDGFDAAVDLSMQALSGIDDDPRQKLLIKLRETHFPAPYGRNSMGVEKDLETLTLDVTRAEHARRYQARGAILAIAGDVDFAAYREEVGRLFGGMTDRTTQPPPIPPPAAQHKFEVQESEQTHIGIAYPSIPETHSDYYVMRMAMETLSGGMSGRLFTEVREKRGLCYSVWAGYSALAGAGGGQGSITGYAGTSNERAQATLDTFIGELHRLSLGITADELSRAKIGLKASTIMSGESTSARAGAIAHDWFVRGRLRTLDEIKASIDAVTVEDLNAYLARHKPGPFTVVVVGPKELVVPA